MHWGGLEHFFLFADFSLKNGQKSKFCLHQSLVSTILLKGLVLPYGDFLVTMPPSSNNNQALINARYHFSKNKVMLNSVPCLLRASEISPLPKKAGILLLCLQRTVCVKAIGNMYSLQQPFSPLRQTPNAYGRTQHFKWSPFFRETICCQRSKIFLLRTGLFFEKGCRNGKAT